MLGSTFEKMSQFKIKNYLTYIQKDLIILRYWDKSTNFGDFMNPFIVRSILQKPVVSSYQFINFLNKPELLGMGSIIIGDLSRCVIWGSGIISPKVKINSNPLKVLHVRGKKTAAILQKRGVVVPPVYGDPAFLLPDIYTPKKEKKYKLGIIPHYCEVNLPVITSLRKMDVDDVKVINPLDNFKDVLSAINQCEYIASSSLHGLIVAEAYGIPTLRLHLSGIIQGGDFKFEDHYSALHINRHKKYYLDGIEPLKTSGFYESFTKKEIGIDLEEMKMGLQENFG